MTQSTHVLTADTETPVGTETTADKERGVRKEETSKRVATNRWLRIFLRRSRSSRIFESSWFESKWVYLPSTMSLSRARLRVSKSRRTERATEIEHSLLPVDEPLGDLELERVLHDGDDALELVRVELAGTERRMGGRPVVSSRPKSVTTLVRA
jgi:hypothetical protein